MIFTGSDTCNDVICQCVCTPIILHTLMVKITDSCFEQKNIQLFTTWNSSSILLLHRRRKSHIPIITQSKGFHEDLKVTSWTVFSYKSIISKLQLVIIQNSWKWNIFIDFIRTTATKTYYGNPALGYKRQK